MEENLVSRVICAVYPFIRCAFTPTHNISNNPGIFGRERFKSFSENEEQDTSRESHQFYRKTSNAGLEFCANFEGTYTERVRPCE